LAEVVGYGDAADIFRGIPGPRPVNEIPPRQASEHTAGGNVFFVPVEDGVDSFEIRFDELGVVAVHPVIVDHRYPEK